MAGTRNATPGGRVGATRLHRSGADAQRILVVADGELLGVTSERTFADALADRIAARTGRGVDLDVTWELGPVLAAVTRATEAWRLWRYEVVVVLAKAVGVDGAGRWRTGRVRRLAERVLPSLADASSVLVVRVGDGATSGSRWDGPSVTSISLVPAPDGTPGNAGADRVAQHVVGLLRGVEERAAAGAGGTAGERRARPDHEEERQHAVDRVHDALGGLTPHLERVVVLARNTFEVPFAQVNLVDHGTIRTLAYIGAGGDGAEHPICTIAVRGSGPTIIADTWDDPRLDTNPHVHGTEHPVRFYAAHPIESIDGYRIGTLCVFDLKPHDPSEIDPSVLRDLALLAEAEISALP